MTKAEVGARLAARIAAALEGRGMKVGIKRLPHAQRPAAALLRHRGLGGPRSAGGGGSRNRTAARRAHGGALRHRHRIAAWLSRRRCGRAPAWRSITASPCLNAPGTIDSDYRGEIKAILINHGDKPFRIARGAKIAQMVIARHEQAELVETRSPVATARAARAASARPA